MAIELSPLPYPKDALAPHISAETLDFHYGKHHAGYVKKLNTAIENTDYAEKSLEEIIKTSEGGVFNNSAQVWNHTFYWNSLSPQGGGEPQGEMAQAIDKSFGSFREFKEKFTTKAVTLFGSGWVWLVQNPDHSLGIEQTFNAGCPSADKKPLLTCDVWEHAYYIDYRNARPDYVTAFWNLVNWNFASQNLETNK